MQETQERQVRFLSSRDLLEVGMATHSSTLAWKIPWTEEDGGPQSMGSQRVRHGWATEHTHIAQKIKMVYGGFSYASSFSAKTACSVQFSSSIMSDSLQPHEPQHARLPCSSPTPRVYSNSCPLSQWCHPAISSSVIPFSSCLQSFPTSGSFPMSQLFASGGLSIGVSASILALPMNIQDWFPLGWTGCISLQSKGLSRVFSNTTVEKLCAQHFL